jgi:hypothetical protein
LYRNFVLKPAAMTDSRIAKWQRWLDTIESQVITLHWHRSIYDEVGAITRANTSLPSSDFFQLVSTTYIHSQAVAVRPFLDLRQRGCARVSGAPALR